MAFGRVGKKVGRVDDVFYEGTSKARVSIHIIRHPNSFGWGVFRKKVNFHFVVLNLC